MKRAAPHSASNGKTRHAEPFHDSDALAGLALPELAQDLPTTLLTVHAAFTAQHVICELRYQYEMGLLTKYDLQMLVELGRDIAQGEHFA